MKLVIVESPTKARKLTEYLGNDFKIQASVGHVRDLPKSKLGVDVDENFEPTYVVNPDKKKVIKELKAAAKKAESIYLATDPDREGEAIAWHIQHILKDDLKSGKFFRSTFHEITKPAVKAAIDKPGELNQDLVDAQQARRVLDRLVGYKLSPVLWKKIRRGLSAGRVQSVALRLIAEREKEIAAFVPDEYWEVAVALNVATGEAQQIFVEGKPVEDLPEGTILADVVKRDGKKYEPKTNDDVQPLVDVLPDCKYLIDAIEEKQRKRASLPPFTTSTLQQTAATRLSMTSKQTMRLAQQLYEEGLITYHRTDSVALSSQAIETARGFIGANFGNDYVPAKPRLFKGKSKNAQEAHEAVRVTDVGVKSDNLSAKSGKLTARHAQLYDLIWRRFVASQMETAVYNQTSIKVSAIKDGKKVAGLKSNGSVLKFDGWMKLFPAGSDRILPAVEEKQELFYRDVNPLQKFTQPPARYNDASLVKELEKRGIGRPSTYASIISVIEDRGYVSRDARRFVATPVGITVSDFLVEHFDKIMDYDFTAEMEEDLDRVSRGEKEWRKVISVFYKPFEKKLDTVVDKAERVQVPVEKTGVKCPTCGDKEDGEIVIRTGKYGKFKSCSRYPECDFTENIVVTLDDQLCPLCGVGGVVVKPTRWGREFYGCANYPKCDWASWKKPEKDLKVTKAEWEEEKKLREERKKKRAATMKKKAPKKTTKKKTTKKTVKKATKKKPAAKAKKSGVKKTAK